MINCHMHTSGSIGLGLVFVTALAASPVQAQTAEPELREGRGYLTIGLGMLDLDDVNQRLTDRGYPTFPEKHWAIGAGGHGIRDRWVFGAEGQALLGRTKDATPQGQSVESALNAGYGFLNLGYLAARRGSLHAYPFAGIGGGGVQLKLSERSTPAFDEVLLDPGRSANLTTAGLVFQIGFAVDHLFTLRTHESGGYHRVGGLVLGIRAGYVFMPVQTDWRLDGRRLAAGPDLAITGPYIRVVVGGGGSRSKS